MLTCVINVSEGRDDTVLAALADACGTVLLDLHRDGDHHRSVLTLGDPDPKVVEEAAFSLVEAAVARLDLARHAGVHPRLGVADVVPFVPLLPGASLEELGTASLEEAATARDRFCQVAASDLGLPCFRYGPLPGGGERTLPEIRRRAFVDLPPDAGPIVPHPSAGAACVGARRCLGAYNLLLEGDDLGLAKGIARSLRSPEVRALAFPVAGGVQVSCNLVAPWRVGPLEVYEAVTARARVASCELVGLLPLAVAQAVPADLRLRLDCPLERTLEARLGLGGDDLEAG